MRSKLEEGALSDENIKLFNKLNLWKIQKILSNIVKLPDLIKMDLPPKS